MPVILRTDYFIDQLSAFSPMRPSNREAFVNVLTLLQRAQITEGHEPLFDAVQKAAIELGMTAHPEYMPTIKHIAAQKRRARRSRVAGIA